jgi:hypothetical protein
MITIAKCGDWQECQLLKSRLEAAGIPAFVPDEMSNLDGLMIHFGGFRIQEAEENAEAARAFLGIGKTTGHVTESDGPTSEGPAAGSGSSDEQEGRNQR